MTTFDITYARATTRVTVAPGALASLGTALADRVVPGKVLVVSDSTVAGLYGDAAVSSLSGAGFKASLDAFAPGDETKSLATVELIYAIAAASGLTRDDVVLALGGGVVSDLAGFAAATWMRGVRFAICPTTVEADIDASIGGKTGVNHRGGKNLIGAFHQPVLVQIDPECLRTLGQRDVVAGLAESIKHAVITDEAFLGWHEQNRDAILAGDPDVMRELIERNVRIKADVVTRDEREGTALRASLNFGHTIGHAIESARGYELRHGECVALGMVAACRMCVALGRLAERDCERVTRCIESLGLPTKLPSPPPIDEILRYVGSDKKAAKGKVRFVLLDGLGKTELCDDVAEDVIREAYEAVIGETVVESHAARAIGKKAVLEYTHDYLQARPPRCVKALFAAESDEQQVAAQEYRDYGTVFAVACNCGNNTFAVNIPDSFGTVSVLCTACRSRVDLFDAACHGWDGEFGHPADHGWKKTPSKERPCECQASAFRLVCVFSYSALEEFLDDGTIEVAPEDLFDWFTLIGTCSSCGKKADLWSWECTWRRR